MMGRILELGSGLRDRLARGRGVRGEVTYGATRSTLVLSTRVRRRRGADAVDVDAIACGVKARRESNGPKVLDRTCISVRGGTGEAVM